MDVTTFEQSSGTMTIGGCQTGYCVPVQSYPFTYPYPYYITVPPTECSGDVHVFPCAKCGGCKCGRAKLAKTR